MNLNECRKKFMIAMMKRLSMKFITIFIYHFDGPSDEACAPRCATEAISDCSRSTSIHRRDRHS